MRVLGLTIGRTEKPPQGSSGSSSPFGNAIQDLMLGGPDVNPLLSGPNKYPVYDEMRSSNPAVRSSLWMFKLPIRSAHADFEPVSDDPLDQLVADACRWQFGLAEEEGQLDRSWDEQLVQRLLMLDWGAQFEEDVWARDSATWIDADGDEHVFWRLARTAQRAPSTVETIKTDFQTGQISYIKQNLPGTTAIPGTKLAAYTLDREGDDWLGHSLLRPMWGAWRMQKALMIQCGIAWGRFGTKTPVVYYPNGKRQEALQIAHDYKFNEQGHFAFEGPGPGGPAPPQWMIELVGPDLQGDPVPLLRWYSEQIAASGLQQFTSLGTSQTGSRAVGDVLVEPFTMACVAVAKQIATVMHRGPVRRFVDFNFGMQVPAPRLKFSKIQMRGLDVLTAAISDLAAAGLEFADPDTQNDLRSQMQLPGLPDDFVPGVAPAGMGTEGGLSPSDTAALAASNGGAA